MNCQSSTPGRKPESTVAGIAALSRSARKMSEKWAAASVTEPASDEVTGSGSSMPPSPW